MARSRGLGTASLVHLAWALALSRLTGRSAVLLAGITPTTVDPAIVAAAAIGEWVTALAVTVFALCAEVLEELSMDRGRDALTDLMSFLPQTARVVGAPEAAESAESAEAAESSQSSGVTEVPLDEVRPGQVIAGLQQPAPLDQGVPQPGAGFAGVGAVVAARGVGTLRAGGVAGAPQRPAAGKP